MKANSLDCQQFAASIAQTMSCMFIKNEDAKLKTMDKPYKGKSWSSMVLAGNDGKFDPNLTC